MATATLSFPAGSLKSAKIQTGLFIGGEFVPSADGATLEVTDPSTGKKICDVSEAKSADVDKAVKAAQHAYDTVWGVKCPAHERGKLLIALAEAIEANKAELAAIEALDNGKPRAIAEAFDVSEAAACLRYYGGWADKNSGRIQEVHDQKLALIRHEPIGVVGQIIPWNFPILMFAWKIAPALATGNAIVMKTSENTPLSALKVCELAAKILPKGVLNVLTGYGKTAGQAIAEHMDIQKVAFTGSTLVGRQIMKAAAASNLKRVTLELGGKSPNIVFADADIDQAVKWASFGLFFNMGQCCCAGSRIYVESSIYDKFLEKLRNHMKSMKQGSPFQDETFLGPQVSQVQYDRIMNYIEDGKKAGGKIETGGNRQGSEGYFIEPTIFTDVKQDAKIMQEEIFGPVVIVSKFENEQDLIKTANDTVYGLAAAVFTSRIDKAFRVAHELKAGTVWINCYNQLHSSVEFGGYKTSGIGRELGQMALENYTAVKSIHVNLGTDNAP